MKDIVKEKQLKEVLYGLDYIANKAKSGKLELGVNNCKLLLEEIERLNNIIKEAISYINNHQLVFELSSKKEISKWCDMFYKELLDILYKLVDGSAGSIN